MRSALLILAAALLVAGCGGDSSDEPALPQGSEPVELDPNDFSSRIDHPYWPLLPGVKWVYRETDADGSELRVEVTVTDRTKLIMGIEARVVHDVVTEDGRLVEDTKEFENGKPVSASGSWEAGVDGAQAGILLPADPEVGMTYRQEYYKGEAEDAAEVLSVDEKVEVPFGAFKNVLMTKDYTPLDPDILEHKFYARGVGPILAITLSGGSDREELLRFTKP